MPFQLQSGLRAVESSDYRPVQKGLCEGFSGQEEGCTVPVVWAAPGNQGPYPRGGRPLSGPLASLHHLNYLNSTSPSHALLESAHVLSSSALLLCSEHPPT